MIKTILGVLLLIGVLTGCAPSPGATITNETDQIISFRITKIDVKEGTWSQPVKPQKSTSIGIPKDSEIKLTALYPSGFEANTLYTPQEMKQFCVPAGDSYACQFRFIDNEFKLVENNAAARFASTATKSAISLATLLLAITIGLFILNRRRPIHSEN